MKINQLHKCAFEMKMKVIAIFRSALHVFKMLHDNEWMHKDIKRLNIDVLTFSNRCVLLNFDQTVWLTQKKNCYRVLSVFDKYKTSRYRASKMKKTVYNKSIDIWSMRILFYHFTYDDHSWSYIENSWIEQFSMKDNNSKSNEYLQRRQEWQNQYNIVIRRMNHDVQQTISTSKLEFLHCEWFHFMCQFLKTLIMQRS